MRGASCEQLVSFPKTISQANTTNRRRSRGSRNDPKTTTDRVTNSIPGDEFPPAVYRTIVFAFAWMTLAAWLAFGGATGTDLDLAIATLLFTVFLALPITMYRTARTLLQPQRSKRIPLISRRYRNRHSLCRGSVAPGAYDTDRACARSDPHRRCLRVLQLRTSARPS